MMIEQAVRSLDSIDPSQRIEYLLRAIRFAREDCLEHRQFIELLDTYAAIGDAVPRRSCLEGSFIAGADFILHTPSGSELQTLLRLGLTMSRSLTDSGHAYRILEASARRALDVAAACEGTKLLDLAFEHFCPTTAPNGRGIPQLQHRFVILEWFAALISSSEPEHLLLPTALIQLPRLDLDGDPRYYAILEAGIQRIAAETSDPMKRLFIHSMIEASHSANQINARIPILIHTITRLASLNEAVQPVHIAHITLEISALELYGFTALRSRVAEEGLNAIMKSSPPPAVAHIARMARATIDETPVKKGSVTLSVFRRALEECLRHWGSSVPAGW